MLVLPYDGSYPSFPLPSVAVIGFRLIYSYTPLDEPLHLIFTCWRNNLLPSPYLFKIRNGPVGYFPALIGSNSFIFLHSVKNASIRSDIRS